MRSKFYITLLILSSLLLSGCATYGPGNNKSFNDMGTPPDTYGKQVRNYLNKTLKDPYSIKDLNIGEPQFGHCSMGIFGQYYGWRVPVEYNAKNSFGAYTGLKQYYFWFHRELMKGYTYQPGYCAIATSW